MKKINIFYSVIIFFYIFILISSKDVHAEFTYTFPTTTDEATGEEVVDTNSDAYTACKEVYDILMSQYNNPYVACGILGNLMQESGVTLDPNAGGTGTYRGIGQWCIYDDAETKTGNGRWGKLLDFAASSNNRSGEAYSSRKAQAYFIIYEAPSQIKTAGITYVDFTSVQDVITATEVFCALYERCVGGEEIESNKITSEWIKLKWGTGWNTYYYQDLEKRRVYATECLRVFEGTDVAAYTAGISGSSSDTTSQLKNSGSLLGLSSLGVTIYDWYDTAIDLPSSEDLEISDRVKIANWKEDVEGRNDSGVISWLRAVVAFIGIIIVVYSSFLYIAYWFDRINNFIDISMLSILTLGRLAISPDDTTSTFNPETKGIKVVTHRNMIFICLLGIAFGVILLTGVIYDFIDWILGFVKKFVS